jgi:NADH:ubiquinone oxidoreductase subunit 5 (subunit L)/multisubunit Na+/H+ antiporter MnhA subunit
MLFWIVFFNSFFAFFLIIFFNNSAILFNNQWLVNIRVNEFSLFMVLVCFCISSCVIFNTVNYLSIKESIICLVFIILFQLFMILFIVSNCIFIAYLGWDWLGLISYFRINSWTSKTRNGLKAILFNKLGDIMFLFLIVYYYFFGGIYLFTFDSFNLFLLTLIIRLFSGDIILFCLIIAFIWLALFSKSAMIPFSSWLVSAILAPTPISALLHSSTMVIAGVYFGLLICFLLALCVQFIFLFFIFFILFVCFSLIWSLFKAVAITDIKSIIAYSTISQISYMFLCVLFFPQYSLYHIIIHGLFKSLLFLLSGSLIHVQLNFQSIYKMRVNNLLIKISFILGVCVLILSLSKEGIIHSSYIMISSSWVFFVLIIGGMLTCFYSSRLIEFCFCFQYSVLTFYSSSIFIFIYFVSVSLIVDEIFEFCLCSFNYFFIFNLFNLEFLFTFSTFYILGRTFSLVFVFFTFNLFLFFFFKSCIFVIYFYFSFYSRSSYLISFFNNFFLYFLFFVFYPSIYCIEVLSGFKSCYSIYQIHYITCYLLICFFIYLLLLILFIIFQFLFSLFFLIVLFI